jgi:hypothetical protein
MRVQELIEKLQRANDPTAVVVYDWNRMQIVLCASVGAARAARLDTGRMCSVLSVGRVIEVQVTKPEIEEVLL